MSHFRILDLPNELLYYTLEQLCNPDDFESAVLACKTLHDLAKPLLPNHNLCKRLARDPNLEHSNHLISCAFTGHVVIRDPAACLLWVLQKPANLQLQVLRYFKRIMLFPSAMGKHLDLVEKKLSECPTLKEEALNAQGLSRNTPSTDGGPSLENVLLVLLSQVESLILPYGSAWMSYNRPYSQLPRLPELASQAQGTKHFQRLRELYVHGTLPACHHATIVPLLLLPRLETLVLDQFDQSKDQLWDPSRLIQHHGISHDGSTQLCTRRDLVIHELGADNDTSNEVSKRSELLPTETQSNMFVVKSYNLQQLVVFRGYWHSASMGNLLRHLPSLRILTWEDDTPRNMTPGVTHPEVFVEKLFNPLGLLRQLAATHGDKLEQLALFVKDAGGNALILRDHAIVNFKDFVRLKHLEFDTRLLRLGEDWGSLPPSLTEIIPSNLQNLGLFFQECDARTRDALLGTLPESKANFPSLRKIVLKTNSLQCQNHYYHQNQVAELLQKFEEVGVKLRSKEIHPGQNLITFDWDGQTNFVDNMISLVASGEHILGPL